MQTQASNLPISLLGNPLTLFHPELLSVLIQTTSEQQNEGVASRFGQPSPLGP